MLRSSSTAVLEAVFVSLVSPFLVEALDFSNVVSSSSS